MRYVRTGTLILLFMVLGLVQAVWFHLHRAASVTQLSESVTKPTGISSPAPSPGAAPGFYGSGLGTDGLYNIPLGGNWVAAAPYKVKVSWRFRAQHTGLLKSVRPYLMYVDGPGDPGNYSSGDGGTVLVQIQTDDGTANHYPSGTALAEFLYTTPKAGGIAPRLTFPTPLSQLLAGVLYHIVFTNTDADPLNNFVSLNHLWLDVQTPTVPRQPTVSDTDLHTLVQANGEIWDDTTFTNDTPVFELAYADGFAQGFGYIEVWAEVPGGPLPPISGINQTRETFTVSGPSLTVSAISLRAARVSGSDPLTIQLEEGNSTLIEEGAIPASLFPSGPLGPEGTFPSVWVTYTFTTPRTLFSGRSYNLVQSVPATSVYKVFPMRKAAEYGFAPATYFADGRAQQNSGTGWEDWSPASWGTNRPDGDLQFYFTLAP